KLFIIFGKVDVRAALGIHDPDLRTLVTVRRVLTVLLLFSRILALLLSCTGLLCRLFLMLSIPFFCVLGSRRRHADSGLSDLRLDRRRLLVFLKKLGYVRLMRLSIVLKHYAEFGGIKLRHIAFA